MEVPFDDPPKLMRAQFYLREMMLLIFVARLTREFELCYPSQFCNIPREAPLKEINGSSWGRESVKLPVAEALRKGWRFFETYADRQTSPVLRHRFPRRRDGEC
jgi:hypothetical protein